MKALFLSIMVFLLSLFVYQAKIEAEPKGSPQTEQSSIPEKYQRFIDQYKDQAQALSKDSGIPVSVCFSLAIWETQCGTSTLCQSTNNVFNIQSGKKWPGESLKCSEGYVRVYLSIEESITDLFWYLRDRNPTILNSDWIEFCDRAAYYGGESRSDFWNRIKKTIADYELYRYDI